MPVKKHFINKGLQNMLVEEYLYSELENAGYAGCDLQKTPMGTRITIKTARPGLVIGRRGQKVKELTTAVKERFNINVPTIDVETVENPELNAQIQAERVAFAIEKGQNYRRATYGIIRRIIRSGARGVEITISGKVTSQRARVQVFRAGVISKCGTPSIDGVDRGVVHVTLKSGVLGIRVKIMPKSYAMPDEVKIRKGVFDPKDKEKEVDEPDTYYEDDVAIEESVEELDEDDEDELNDLFDDTDDADESVLSEVDEDAEEKEPEEEEKKPSKRGKKKK